MVVCSITPLRLQSPRPSALPLPSPPLPSLPQLLCYHVVGRPQSEDAVVFAMPDHPIRMSSAEVTDDGRWVEGRRGEVRRKGASHGLRAGPFPPHGQRRVRKLRGVAQPAALLLPYCMYCRTSGTSCCTSRRAASPPTASSTSTSPLCSDRRQQAPLTFPPTISSRVRIGGGGGAVRGYMRRRRRSPIIAPPPLFEPEERRLGRQDSSPAEGGLTRPPYRASAHDVRVYSCTASQQLLSSFSPPACFRSRFQEASHREAGGQL